MSSLAQSHHWTNHLFNQTKHHHQQRHLYPHRPHEPKSTPPLPLSALQDFRFALRRCTAEQCRVLLTELRGCDKVVLAHAAGRLLGHHAMMIVVELESEAGALAHAMMLRMKTVTGRAQKQKQRPNEMEIWVIISVHVLLNLHEQTKDAAYLMDVIALVQLVLELETKANFQLTLYLIRLKYHPASGAFSIAMEAYRTLDIKQIQLETSSHILLEDALRFGFIDRVLMISAEIIQFHFEQERDNPDLITIALNQQQPLLVSDVF